MNDLRAVELVGDCIWLYVNWVGTEAHRSTHLVYASLIRKEVDYRIRCVGLAFGAVGVLQPEYVAAYLYHAELEAVADA